MVTQYDEKGKIFTSIITKKPAEVIIHTLLHKITGVLHYRPDNRLIDELNSTNLFLAVTNGKVYDQNNNLLYQSDFITINTNQIIWVIPFDELKLDQVE